MVGKNVRRCEWCGSDPLYIKYHDEEWGKPVHTDRKLFEMLTLDGAQAGLSWITILRKRNNYRKAFDSFDPAKVALYNELKIKELLENPGIVRNRKKIESAINNARALINIKKEIGSFNKYIWRFVDFKPIINRFKKLGEIPAKTELSDEISRDLKERGFSFIGSTICYALMQSIGMVNDHLTHCFRYEELR
ncbi:DNA-3-methyladenine glycosylase I [Bacteroidota bacterium]